MFPDFNNIPAKAEILKREITGKRGIFGLKVLDQIKM